MGAAAVTLTEIDLSTSVASFAGVFGAIVVPAKKGPVRDPQLMSSDSQFLSVYTAKKTIPVGADGSHYSAITFLERANKLWVNRVMKNALYGGLVLKKSASADPNAAILVGMADPTAYVFDDDEDAVLIYAASEGAWANSISIKVITIDDDENLNEPNSFKIQVFEASNLNVPIEEMLVSLTLGQKDASGNNMYVEDVLLASNYIRAFVSPENDSLLPKSQASPLAMAFGNDGVAVTDTEMMAGASDFANESEIPVTILMDGGWSTEDYGQALDAICQARKDCVAILTVPYSIENGSTYLNDIVDYRKNTLNLNSSYSALYTPHVQIADRFNDRDIWIAPDGLVASSISLASNNYEIWYPVAGFKRGILNVKDTVVRFSSTEMDLLQDNGINPIRFTSGKGIVVWGQKTLLSRQSALSRMNVRLMLIVVEPALRDFLENELFDLNDSSVQAFVTIKISSYLDGIVARRGLFAYNVVCNSSNNTAQDLADNKLNVDVYLQPSSSIEAIPVRIIITPASISFTQAQAQV